MDGRRFDAFAKLTVSSPKSRRSALQGVLGGLLATLPGATPAAACTKLGRRCRRDDRCCNGSRCKRRKCQCAGGKDLCAGTCRRPCGANKVRYPDCACYGVVGVGDPCSGDDGECVSGQCGCEANGGGCTCRLSTCLPNESQCLGYVVGSCCEGRCTQLAQGEYLFYCKTTG